VTPPPARDNRFAILIARSGCFRCLLGGRCGAHLGRSTQHNRTALVPSRYTGRFSTRSSVLLTDSFRVIAGIFSPVHPVSLDAEIYVESLCN
jgi:hypothetical protein